MPSVTILDYMDCPSALFSAVLGNKLATLQELLKDPEQKAFINHKINTQAGHTLLFFACYGYSSKVIVEELIQNGADISIKDNRGRTALDLAANSAQLEIVEYLLSLDKDDLLLNRTSAVTGRTPFHAICYPGSGAFGMKKKPDDANVLACFKALFEKSLFILDEILDKEDFQGLTPLILAKHYEMVELLDYFKEEFGAEFVDNYEMPTDIHLLIEEDFYGRTPILEAAFVHNKYIVIEELNKNVDPDKINIQSGRNVLQLIACNDEDTGGALVKKVLEYVTNPVAKDHYERTALHFAGMSGQITTVLALLNDVEVREHLNDKDKCGRTVLHAVAMSTINTDIKEGAQYSSRAMTIRTLFGLNDDFNLDKIIDFNAKDRYGLSALELAEKRQNTVVVEQIKACILEYENKQSIGEKALPSSTTSSPYTPRHTKSLDKSNRKVSFDLAADVAQDKKSASPKGKFVFKN